MLTETFELDLANAGLGGLDEIAFLRLFATTQAHAITHGTGRTLRDIENVDGVPLYPAFYRTRVTLPPPVLFSQFRAWDHVEVGVELRRFGRMLLESVGVLGMPGTLAGSAVARVEGSLVFVHDRVAGDHQVDAPREGTVAELAPMKQRPVSMEMQRRVRTEGVIASRAGSRRPLSGRTSHTLLITRDLQADRAMMFAGFTTLFEVGEQTLLTADVWPRLDPSLLSHARLLDREVFYIRNVQQGDSVVIHTEGAVTPCSTEQTSAYENLVGVAELELFSEIYDTRNRLVATAHTRKLFAAPRDRGSDMQDLQRLLHKHGEPHG